MTTDQAIQNLQSLIDTAVFKGGIFGKGIDCVYMQQSLSLLAERAQAHTQVIVPSKRAINSSIPESEMNGRID